MKPKRHPLVARQSKELKEFIKANPTDAAMWPDPFLMFFRSKRRKRKEKKP